MAQALNILLCALFSRIFHRTRTMSFCQKIIIFPPTLTAYHIAILAVVLNISCASDIFFFYIYIYIFYVRLTSPIFPCAHGVFRFSHSPNIFLELKVKWHKSCSILFRFLPAPFSFSGSYCGGPRVKWFHFAARWQPWPELKSSTCCPVDLILLPSKKSIECEQNG